MQKFILCIAMILGLIVVFQSTDTNKRELATGIVETKTYESLDSYQQKQIRCLAQNIYFEARGEPVEGQLAVAHVTLNRVGSELFPTSICDVVQQKRYRNTKAVCEFSWWCDTNLRYQAVTNKIGDMQLYHQIKQLAFDLVINYNHYNDITQGALFYHANYVSRSKLGRMKLEHTATIGRHIFYRINI